MEKGFALFDGKWHEVDCTSCVHYAPCPGRGRCHFGHGLHNITDKRFESHVHDLLESLAEEQECRKCRRTMEEAYRSWNCLGCRKRLEFPDATWTYAFVHYEPKRGETNGEM